MGTLTHITVDGRIKIPEDVRDALDLKPDDAVEVEWSGGDEVVIRKRREAVLDDEAAYEAELARLHAVAHKYRHLRTGQSSDEYMAEIREPVPIPHPDDV